MELNLIYTDIIKYCYIVILLAYLKISTVMREKTMRRLVQLKTCRNNYLLILKMQNYILLFLGRFSQYFTCYTTIRGLITNIPAAQT